MPPPDAAAGPDAAEPEQRVSALELFFDLVFVFAITQVTQFLAHDPDWTHLVEGLAILTAVWWAWSCYAWLGNTAASDDGLFRVTLLAAMAGMLIAAIAVPHAFGRDALAFGIAYACVRVLHIAAYKVLAREDPTLNPLVALLVLVPIATAIPALASPAAVAALSTGRMAYEFVHFHEARERLRHALT